MNGIKVAESSCDFLNSRAVCERCCDISKELNY